MGITYSLKQMGVNWPQNFRPNVQMIYIIILGR